MAENVLGTVFLVFALGLTVLMIASMWKVFDKADQPGWAAIVPIFNTYIMLKIGDNPGWYLLLMMVPLVNLYAGWKMYVGLAKAFGKDVGWGLGLWFLPMIFFPILAFGDATYRGRGGRSGGQPAI
ncbi:DUF5684 domain-containing protein [Halorussus gelatinilyticus]|uniref:DUF5684 domain-containing protein n=1 Tax=Halorussus gelatinilyticus TaxID=2937524 RepID=A0A8U0IJH4_9EURY|nr:DUF5684 domain-containing protein [Halorussus gelatinilyticus]UPW01270.1 DUF5684 domain-containing protein [Halorussus gelatinilyticus]